MMRMIKSSKAPSSIAVTVFLLTLLVYSANGGVLHNRTHPEPDEDTTIDLPFNAQFETCKKLNSSRSRMRCSNMQPAGNFSLQLGTGTNQFAPKEDVPVKAFMTNCPSTTSPGTKWYTIETFVKSNESNSDGKKVEDNQQLKLDRGKMKARFKHKDVYQCSDDSGIVFYPCEPSPFNFPGKYVWTAPDQQLIGSVCFRLIALQEGSTECEMVEKCIDPATPSSGENPLEEDTDYYDEYSNQIGSGDEIKNTNIETNVVESDDESTSGKAIIDKSLPFKITPKCKKDREFYEEYKLPWKPDCDCQGHYNSVQCNNESNRINENGPEEIYCWCSTVLGDEVTGTRIKIDCDDTKFELSCLANTA